MTRLKANSRSRAASTKDDARVTEMVNGLLVSKPAKKIEEVTEAKTTARVWRLTPQGPVLEQEQESKAASIVPVNKLKVIHDFINRRY